MSSEERKRAMQERFREECASKLQPDEAVRLERYEFEVGAQTFEEQLDRYVLKLKLEKPLKAEKLSARIRDEFFTSAHQRTALDPLDPSLNADEYRCTRAAWILKDYFSGVVLYTQGEDGKAKASVTASMNSISIEYHDVPAFNELS